MLTPQSTRKNKERMSTGLLSSNYVRGDLDSIGIGSCNGICEKLFLICTQEELNVCCIPNPHPAMMDVYPSYVATCEVAFVCGVCLVAESRP